jgi:amidase
MTLVRVPRTAHGFSFSPDARPAARVRPGTRLVFETLDCFSNKITSAGQVFESEDDLLGVIGAFNPVTGPVYVEGASPGDTLAVQIEAIVPGTLEPFAVTLVTGDTPGVCGQPSALADSGPDTRICPLHGDAVLFPLANGDPVMLPLRPMVGSIGTAPADRERSSLEFGPDHGGNLDCPSMTAGSTVLLPVNVPGALLSLGDVHALMGDAEVTGTALETNADVVVTVEVITAAPGMAPSAPPRLDTASAIGSIGCHFGATVEANLAAAFEDLAARLLVDYDLTRVEAFELLGTAAAVQVNQCVAGHWTSVFVSISRDIIGGLRPAVSMAPG